MELVKEKHLRLEVLGSITVDCRSGEIDPMSAAFLQMASIFSELEKNILRARVRSGMANARAKGKQIGRRKGQKSKKYKLTGKAAYIKKERIAGRSKLSLAKEFKVTWVTLNKFMIMNKIQ